MDYTGLEHTIIQLVLIKCSYIHFLAAIIRCLKGYIFDYCD
jgi:hypothetical protein